MSEYDADEFTVGAGKELSLAIHGEFIYFLSASQNRFKFSFGSGSFKLARPGQRIESDRPFFKRLKLRNLSATDPLVIDMAWGSKDVLVQEFKIIKPTTVTTAADESIAANSTELVLPANANRRVAIIGNLFKNAQAVRVGEDAAAAARGREIPPGEEREFETTAALYVHNPDDAAMSVTLMETAE